MIAMIIAGATKAIAMIVDLAWAVCLAKRLDGLVIGCYSRAKILGLAVAIGTLNAAHFLFANQLFQIQFRNSKTDFST